MKYPSSSTIMEQSSLNVIEEYDQSNNHLRQATAMEMIQRFRESKPTSRHEREYARRNGSAPIKMWYSRKQNDDVDKNDDSQRNAISGLVPISTTHSLASDVDNGSSSTVHNDSREKIDAIEMPSQLTQREHSTSILLPTETAAQHDTPEFQNKSKEETMPLSTKHQSIYFPTFQSKGEQEIGNKALISNDDLQHKENTSKPSTQAVSNLVTVFSARHDVPYDAAIVKPRYRFAPIKKTNNDERLLSVSELEGQNKKERQR